MTNNLQGLKELGQSVWFDNIRRGFIESGELQHLIDVGVCGLTSNPSIFEKAIIDSSDYDDALVELAIRGDAPQQIFESLAIKDIQDAADLLRPVFDQAHGADGFASIEVSPHLANDTQGTVGEARRLHEALERPNVMIKVPATSEGIPAIRQLIGEGISVNVTLIFSLNTYAQVREAYIEGLEQLVDGGGDPSQVSSVASFFVSRVDAAVDKELERLTDSSGPGMGELMGRAAISNAKMAYRDFRHEFVTERFKALQDKGARLQRPLWASTSTKNPEYSDVLYVEELVGADTVTTLPDATLEAFLDHGSPASSIERELEDAVLTMERLEDAGVDLEKITDNLLHEGVQAFADSYDALLANIHEKCAVLLSQNTEVSAILGEYEKTVESKAKEIEQRDIVHRVWEGDHTVWKPVPDEISDRLGWLNAAAEMRDQVEGIVDFANQLRREGCRQIVVLGMGGSCLGVLALQRIFGIQEGWPEVKVLDTTIPGAINQVRVSVDCSETLFVVASKSGTTVETNALYHYFRSLADEQLGADDAGRRFVAICDAGTPLEKLAHESGFRRVFINPSDIGGRYSVQSLFGLVPAALMGIDIGELLDRVETMGTACGTVSTQSVNPGAWLGAAIGGLAMAGRDKLTLVTTESLSGFALWVEQLLAESVGKQGRGIIPIVGEPRLEPGELSHDRLVVYVRADGDEDEETDSYVRQVEHAGIPTIRMHLRDKYAIGAEFFRWEFATAIAGSIMRVNPFDQPDVQRAKDNTGRLLKEYQHDAVVPSHEPVGSLAELLSQSKAGEYLAICAYTTPSRQLEDAIAVLRARVSLNAGIATTFAYGPRYLHSTGQLHKGGTASGVFLQLTQIGDADVKIPGEKFTFGVLAAAQAKGDLDALADDVRPVARVDLGLDAPQAIQRLVNSID